MMRSVLNKAVAVLLTAVVMLHSVGSGMVLCLGSDGHVGIEPATKGACRAAAHDEHDHCETKPDATVYAVSHGDCCFRCVDIPLTALPATDFQLTERNIATQKIMPVAQWTHGTLPSFESSLSRVATLAAAEDAFPRPDRTVVLRI